MRKVIIIDNNRVGLFDLHTMDVDNSSLLNRKLSYDLNIIYDEVIESKSLVRKLMKLITRRKKYEKNKRRNTNV